MRRFRFLCLWTEESFEDLKRDGMKEAEAGNFGKALSLLSHAADINAQDYKLFEMIAQVRDWMIE